MHKKTIIAASVLALTALIAFLFIPRAGDRVQRPPKHLTIAASTDPSSALVFVASEKGFFRAEGVDVTLLMHTTGKAALASMDQGKADLATVADTVLMFAGMDGRPVAAVASLAESSGHHAMIGLKSHGVLKPEDLRGKRIGVPVRTTGEFFLYTFLLFRGIPMNEVTVVDMQPEQMAKALESGAVDAVSVFFPVVTKLEKKLAGKISEFEDDNYLMTWNLVAGSSFIRKRPESIIRTLKALHTARRFLAEHPEESAAITARATGSDLKVLSQHWTNYRFGLRLSESLIIDLEDQARWALKRYYPGRSLIPDFTDYIYTAGLRSVDPAAVGILNMSGP